MAIKKRCNRCMKYVRVDGTCQNPNCVRYVPNPVDEVPEGAEVLEHLTQDELEKM